MAQRYGYQDAPQNRSDRGHSRSNDRPRDTHDNRRGNNDRGNDDHRDNDRNGGDRNGSDRTWRQQQPDPRSSAPEPRSSPPEQRYERSPSPDRQRYQEDQGRGQGQRPPERPPERPREVPLTDILRNLRGQYGGQHLDAQRSGENYVIPWLSRDGRRMTVVVDAATGRVISVR
ncbi:MAG: hypothetical protein ABI740_01755 [Alphaproteobacteria bacterium]